MPRTRRQRVLTAAPERIWETISDPEHLWRWWPRVQRVEAVQGQSFTVVMATDRGRFVRADHRVVESVRPRAMRWVQDLADTPFAKILRDAQTSVALEPVDGGTRVTVALDQRLRGMARFGGFMVSRAARRQLDEALDGLERLHV